MEPENIEALKLAIQGCWITWVRRMQKIEEVGRYIFGTVKNYEELLVEFTKNCCEKLVDISAGEIGKVIGTIVRGKSIDNAAFVCRMFVSYGINIGQKLR